MNLAIWNPFAIFQKREKINNKENYIPDSKSRHHFIPILPYQSVAKGLLPKTNVNNYRRLRLIQ